MSTPTFTQRKGLRAYQEAHARVIHCAERQRFAANQPATLDRSRIPDAIVIVLLILLFIWLAGLWLGAWS